MFPGNEKLDPMNACGSLAWDSPTINKHVLINSLKYEFYMVASEIVVGILKHVLDNIGMNL